MNTRNTSRSCLVALVLAGLLSFAGKAAAQDQTSWQVGNGNWFFGFNWTGGKAPNAIFNDQIIFIDNGGTPFLSTSDGFGVAMAVGDTGIGFLEISGAGTLQITDQGGANQGLVIIGDDAGSDGTINVSGGSFDVDNQIFIGNQNGAKGTLVVSGGQVSAGDQIILANQTGSEGTVTVSGGMLSAPTAIGVGIGGTGTLNVTGGTVQSNNLIIGTVDAMGNPLGTGTLNLGTGTTVGVLDVTFIGALSDISGTINVNHNQADYFLTRDGTAGGGGFLMVAESFNHFGSGQSTVLNSALDFTGKATITDGTIVVGPDSFFGSQEEMIIGSSNAAGLNPVLEVNGVMADVDNTKTTVGELGTGTVKHSLGFLSDSTLLTIGGGGEGRYELSNAGVLTTRETVIGRDEGSMGEVIVTGGLWNDLTLITVGDAGEGRLEVSGSGDINAQDIVIGAQETGSGVLTQSSGSVFSPTNVTVGGAGEGRVEVSGTGDFRAQNLTIGQVATGEGEMVVSDNALMIVFEELIVGESGTGSLTLNGTGTRLLEEVVLGANAGSMGTMTVNGGQLDVDLNVNVGFNGSGELVVNGGTSTFGFLSVGSNSATSMGKVSINGGSVSATMDGSLLASIQVLQNGSIDISGTGSLSSLDTVSVAGQGAGASLTVRERGSLSATNRIGVGASAVLAGGKGTVNVQDSAEVETAVTWIGRALVAGTEGILNMSGGTWTTSGETIVGGLNDGQGTLNLTGGIYQTDTLFLGGDAADTVSAISAGTVNFGTGSGTTAGILDTAKIDNVVNTGTVNFNHSESNYFFTRNGTSGGDAIEITGGNTLNHLGDGTTTLRGANTHTGGTNLVNGVLAISADNQLGGAPNQVTFSGGTLRILQTLTTDREMAITGGTTGTILVDPSRSLTHTGVISGAGGLIKSGAGDLVMTNINTYSGGTFFNEGALTVLGNPNLGASLGSLTFNGGTLGTAGNFTMNRFTRINAGGGTFQINSPTGITQNGNITGTGRLTKTGNGFLLLDGNGSWSGGTTVENGVLNQGSANALPDHTPYTVNGGTLLLGHHLTASELSGTGGTVDYLDGLTVDQDTDTTYAGAMLSSGSFTKSGSGQLTLSGVMSGNGNVTVEDGTLVLSGNNTYSGGNNLNGGVLSISADTNLGAFGNDLVFNGGTLRNTADITSSRESVLNAGGGTYEVANGLLLRLNSSITGTGGLTKTGGGDLILNGTNTYSGGTTINAGRVFVSSANELGNPSGGLTLNGGTLATIGSNALDHAVTLGSSGGTIEVVSDAILLSSAVTGTGDLVKNGNGNLIFTQASSYSGTTTINGGELELRDGATVGAGTVFNNSELEIRQSSTDTVIANDIVGGAGSLTRFTGSAQVELSGLLSGGQEVSTSSSSGTLVLSNSGNSYTGGTTVNRSTLRIAASGATGNGDISVGQDFFSGGTIIFGDGVTESNNIGMLNNAVFSVEAGDEAEQAGFVFETGGSFSLNKTGDGTLTLSEANTYTGGTTVEGGLLIADNLTGSATGTGAVTVENGGAVGGDGFIAGTVTLETGGLLAPGMSPGELTLGGLAMSAGSTFQVELGGVVQGSEYDFVHVTGTAALAGDLEVVWFDGFTGSVGNTFTFLRADGGITGDFDSIVLPTLTGGKFWQTFNDGTLYSIAVVPEPSTAGLLLVGLIAAALRRKIGGNAS